MIKRTKDVDLIKSIMTTDGLFETVSDDQATKDSLITDIKDEIWLVVSDGDLSVGCFRVEQRNSSTIDVHINILPKLRNKYSQASGILFYEWVMNNEQIKKVTVSIPVIYENVKNYCIGFGFIQEGLNRLSILKNGQMVDQFTLGITRDEIKGVLNEFV